MSILIRWKGLDCRISLDAERRWAGPPDLIPQLEAAFPAADGADDSKRLAAAAERLAGTLEAESQASNPENPDDGRA